MTIADAMANNYIDQNEYNSMTNTPEITAQQNDYKKQKEEVLKLQAEYDGIEDEVEQTLKWTWATKRARDRMIRNKQKELLGPLNLAINMANLSLWMLTQLKEDKTKLFTTNLWLYQAKQAEASQLAQEQRQQAFQSAQDVKNFEQQKEIMKLQQDYQKADIQTDIIQVGNKNVLINRKTWDTIKSFDMPTETTKNDYIKMWEDSLYDPVSKTWITKPGTTTSTTWTPVSTIDLLKWAEWFRDKAYQDVAGNWTIGYGFTSVNGKPVKAGDTITQQEADAQLANKAQQYTKFANLVKVPLSDAQKSALTSFEYNLWSGIWTKSKWWAQEVINKINAGDFAGAWEEMKKFVNAWGKFYQWLLNRRNKEADLLNQTWTTTWTSYTDQQIWEISYLVELQEKNPTQASKDMKELWYSPKDLANYKAGNMPLTEKQKNSSVEVTNSIKDLIINYDWNDAVGKFDYSRVLWLQWAEDAKLAIDNLVAKLTLPNLWVLKWPMSDKDIEFIKSASSKLWTTQSNKSFETNIIDAYNLSARRAGLPEIKTLSDINKTPTTQTAWKTSTQYWWKVYTFN